MKRLKSGWKVTVAACVAAVSLCFGALNAGADVNINSNTQLDDDANWTGQGTVTIAAGVTLDLNGHKLFVDGLAGTGTITDSTDTTVLGGDILVNGGFENTTGVSSWGYVKNNAKSSNWETDDPGTAGFTKANTTWSTDVKGTYSALIQKTGNFWQTVEVLEAGDYVLTYSYKGRPKYLSHPMTVVVDGLAQTGGQTVAAADWAINTVALYLTAGSHKIEFLGLTGDDKTTVLDDVSLRKVPMGELHVVVTEGQTAEVASVKLQGALKLVTEGAGTCLLKSDCDWTGVKVLIDTTLDLCGHNLSIGELKGSGTVTDSTALGENLIVDGSFEETIDLQDLQYGYFSYPKTTSTIWKTDTISQAGFTKANTTWASDVKGTISALVQKTGNLWQTVTVTEAGDYALTYSYKSRKNFGQHDLAVLVDGAARQCGKATSAADWNVNLVVLHLTAGEHKIEFVGLATADLTTILDDVSLRKIPAAGELHVVVPDGKTAEVTSVKLEGALKLVKEGEGTYLVSYKSGDGIKTWYLGGTSVKEGCFKVHQPANGAQADYNFYKTQQLGAQGSETTVEKGATFDYGGNYDGYLYTMVLNGGTYGNLGIPTPRENGTPFYFRLTADSFMIGNSDTQLGETDLAGYTLDVTLSAGSLYPCGAIRNGTIISRGGRFFPRKGVDCSTADLVLEGTMSCYMGTIPFHDLKVTSTDPSFGHGVNYFTVSGTYTPVSDLIHRFKLLNGSTIDLSGRTTALPVPDADGLFFEENATVYVDLGDRQVNPSELLITWKTKPKNVDFIPVDGVDGTFRILDEGLIFVADAENVPTIAHWTGMGDVTDVSDPGNWACTNKYGRVVEKAIPEVDSTVYFPREIPFNPAGTSFTCKEIVLADNSVLKMDCDFTGLNVAIDTTLDLCGHNLSVSELKGTGTVTDSTTLGENLIVDGSFEETIDLQDLQYGYFSYPKTTSTIWKTDTISQAGFTKANTPWVADVKGNISAFVQKNANIWQTVTVTEAGDYALTYSYKSRKGYDPHELNVKVDGQVRGATSSAAGWAVNTVVLHLEAGSHKVEFCGLMEEDRTTVLDDVSLQKIPAAGELHVVVPKGQTVEVTSVKLEGTLKLVKEGEGTYLVSYKSGDGIKTSYLGGTSVKEGCLKVQQPASAGAQADYNFYKTQQLGAQGSETMVEKGATFDYGGNYDGYIYTVVLNGGTYCNMGTFASARDNGTPFYLRLTADSFVNCNTDTQLGETDLAGFTLDARSKGSLYSCGAIRNGTIISRGGRFYPRKGVDCSTADLVLEGTMSCSMDTIPFHDLKVTSTAGSFGYGNNNYYTVSGTYTPVSDQIHRFKLLNGSSIDLSGRTTALPLPDTNGLFFEENAKVYVALGERKVKSSEPLITWNAKPANVKFRAVPGTTGSFVAKEDGLYRCVGFGIIIR